MKWIKKQDDCEPWKNPVENGPELPNAGKWPPIFATIGVCAVIVTLSAVIWMTPAEKDVVADPTGQDAALQGGGRNLESDGAGICNIPNAEDLSAETLLMLGHRPSVQALRNAEIPYVFYDVGKPNTCGELYLKDTLFHKVTDDDIPETVYADIPCTEPYVEYCGEIYVVRGDTIKKVRLWTNDIVNVPDASWLGQTGKVPTLELLQRAAIQNIYDENGEQIALFEKPVAQYGTGFPANPELPEVVYVDEICSGRYLDYCGALYILFDSGNYKKVTIPNRAVFDTLVTLPDGTKLNTIDSID